MYDEDAELRVHIRNILLDYALTHLTTDYVAYTQTLTEEFLLPALHPIPLTDSTSFVLEPSIPKVVASTFNGSQPPSYEERWPLDLEVTAYIKRSVSKSQARYPSERCWHEDHDYQGIDRPSSPILTLKAIRKTPKLGARSAAQHVPDFLKSLTAKFDIRRVADESTVSVKMDIDTTLGDRLLFDDETYIAASTFLKSVISSGRPYLPPECNHVHNFLRADSPDHSCIELLDTPIFPINKQQKGSNSSSNLRHPILSGVKDLVPLLPTVPEDQDSEEEIYKQHMVIVDGWQAFQFPSSPLTASTPSMGSCSSQIQEVDEFFLPSPPGTSYRRELENARMDDIEIPRCKRTGSTQDYTGNGLGEGQSLSAFLSGFQLSQAADLHVSSKLCQSPSSAPISESMVGQFGDLDALNGLCLKQFEERDALPSTDDVGSDDIGCLLQAIFQEELPKDPSELILNEKLDERESLLMDVPDLSSPTSGAANRSRVPASLSDLLLHTESDLHTKPPELHRACSSGFLQRIQGLKSLNMELSWRPFNFGDSVPTNEEVSRLDKNVQAECLNTLKEVNEGSGGSSIDDILFPLLERATLEGGTAAERSELSWSLNGQHDEEIRASTSGDDGEEFVLTAAERRRIHGLSDPFYAETELVDEGFEDEIEQEFPSKRTKHQSQDSHTCPEETAPPPRRARTVHFDDTYDRGITGEDDYCEPYDYFDTFDDSGIYLPQYGYTPPEQKMSNHNRLFGDLTEMAEGYAGRNEDGDVVPDIDPVHFDGGLFDGAPHSHDATLNLRELEESLFNLPLSPQPPQEYLLHPRDDAAPVPEFPNPTANVDQRQSIPDPRSEPSGIQRLPLPAQQSKAPPSMKSVSASRPLLEFMKLRLQDIDRLVDAEAEAAAEALNGSDPDPVVDVVAPGKSSTPLQVPSDLLDQHVLVVENDGSARPSCSHRYVASLDFIQKRGLVQALSRQRVDLSERETLGDVDLIIDHDTAVSFVPLRSLPAQCEAVSKAINRISWHFRCVLIVFETFSPSVYFQTGANVDKGPVANPFSPPAIKAVKKLKRDMGIAEACEDKRVETDVYFSFPLSVDEAAKAVRMFGDMAHDRLGGPSVLWGDRTWLDIEEEDTDEQDLAAIDGMNVFAAAAILSSISLDDFLDMTAQERIDQFGTTIGEDRIITFNRVIARRIDAMQLPPSSPPTTSLGNSNPIMDGVCDNFTAEITAEEERTWIPYP
ncbi:hypothetical protein NM688_g6155 [Phlebia brevispora]|uniref:Uncharacterized protein n=1 Tax=Phlebia brevispora TaxID=194682 RepID=A0ACC1SJ91_9APHY|nr:hypothetical protein NM688_g6155 [Phlebia brevispora]